MENWKKGRKTINIICCNCNKPFDKDKSEFERGEKSHKNHFCSRKCGYEYHTTHDRDRRCKKCGEKIISKDLRTLFCSHNCSASFNNKNRKGEKRNFSEQGMKNIIAAIEKRIKKPVNSSLIHCKYCGNEILSNLRIKFCNNECKRNYQRKNITEYQKYYKDCQFNFNLSNYPNEFDFDLIKKYGWYQAKNHGDNLNGISRDHMISIKHGYENNISTDIIKHPANCQLMRHNDNVHKYKKCSLTLEELTNKINEWNIKYGSVA